MCDLKSITRYLRLSCVCEEVIHTFHVATEEQELLLHEFALPHPHLWSGLRQSLQNVVVTF